MRDILVSIIFSGWLAIVFVQPWVGVLLWSWIGYMNPHRLSYGFAASFPFGMIVALVTMLRLLISTERKIPRISRELIVLILLLLWFTFTTILAHNPDFAWLQWNKVMKIQLMIIITLIVINTKERIHALLWVIGASLGYFGFQGTIYAIITGGGSSLRGPSGSFISGNTDLALALAMTVPLLRYLHLSAKSALFKWGAFGIMGLTCFATLITYSRGGLLALVAVCGMLVVKSRRRLPLILIGLILIPVVFFAMPSKWIEKMDTIDEYEEDASAMGRINAWRFCINLLKHYPITGRGFGAFTPELFQIYAPNPNDYHDAHSIFFKIAGEHGLVGLFLFVLLFFLAWRTGSWIIRSTRERADLQWAADLSRMLQVSLVGYFVGGVFLGMCYFDLPYHVVALLVLIREIVIEQLPPGMVPAAVPPERSKAVRPAVPLPTGIRGSLQNLRRPNLWAPPP